MASAPPSPLLHRTTPHLVQQDFRAARDAIVRRAADRIDAPVVVDIAIPLVQAVARALQRRAEAKSGSGSGLLARALALAEAAAAAEPAVDAYAKDAKKIAKALKKAEKS